MRGRLAKVGMVVVCLGVLLAAVAAVRTADKSAGAATTVKVTDSTEINAVALTKAGRSTFRYDTFADEAFWGGTLRLHEAIEGSAAGGVGPGVSPKTALAVGLKVDSAKLPRSLIAAIKAGKVNLDSPKTTLALLKLNSVVGVKAYFNPNGSLKSVGITCALCHSTVNNSVAFGIGGRLDGWANRDLNVGEIINLSPDLSAVVDLLKVADPTITDAEVRDVLKGWGPGKFDAELFLDGKAVAPGGKSAATMIPNAYDMAGQNLHTWTGWGSVPYWNAFVAVLEMHGRGTFFDERLDDADKFPIAAEKKFGHIRVDPDQDRVTKVLPRLHTYQVCLPAPKPRAGVDYNAAAAARGDALFSGQAKCNNCHSEPLWTEPGWDVHTPAEMGIDSFQADRSPEGKYKTMNLSGIFVRERGIHMASENKGRFYHDGRFKTLMDVVESYNTRFELGLTPAQMSDVVEYLKSL